MRRVLPEHVELISKGTHVVLTLGGFDDITGRYVRSIWDRNGDRGRGSGLIGLDRGKPTISWFGLGAHHVWISTNDAAVIELWATYGIRGYVHPRGIVISHADEQHLVRDIPRRTPPNQNHLRVFAGVEVIVAPDWTFEPMALAQARLAAHGRRLGRGMLGAWQQIWAAFLGYFQREDRP